MLVWNETHQKFRHTSKEKPKTSDEVHLILPSSIPKPLYSMTKEEVLDIVKDLQIKKLIKEPEQIIVKKLSLGFRFLLYMGNVSEPDETINNISRWILKVYDMYLDKIEDIKAAEEFREIYDVKLNIINTYLYELYDKWVGKSELELFQKYLR